MSELLSTGGYEASLRIRDHDAHTYEAIQFRRISDGDVHIVAESRRSADFI